MFASCHRTELSLSIRHVVSIANSISIIYYYRRHIVEGTDEDYDLCEHLILVEAFEEDCKQTQGVGRGGVSLFRIDELL